MTDRELMQKALTALIAANQYIFLNAKLPFPSALNETNDAVRALRVRLSQGESND